MDIKVDISLATLAEQIEWNDFVFLTKEVVHYTYNSWFDRELLELISNELYNKLDLDEYNVFIESLKK